MNTLELMLILMIIFVIIIGTYFIIQDKIEERKIQRKSTESLHPEKK